MTYVIKTTSGEYVSAECAGQAAWTAVGGAHFVRDLVRAAKWARRPTAELKSLRGRFDGRGLTIVKAE